MPHRVAPFNTYLTYFKPESVTTEIKQENAHGERRQTPADRRQAGTDRRKNRMGRRLTDEKSLAPILQDLRSSFSFLSENEPPEAPPDYLK